MVVALEEPLGFVWRGGLLRLFCLGHCAIRGLGNGLLLCFNSAVAAHAGALAMGNLAGAPEQEK